MNLYQKLVEVRKECAYLKQANQGFKFNYVSSSQALMALRGKMDDLGLVLAVEVLSHKVSDHTTKNGGNEFFTELDISYTWINADNPEETLPCRFYAQGLDSGEKGVGKALTYAEKYFLLKFFNIATDKYDPDRVANEQAKKEAQKNGNGSSKPAANNRPESGNVDSGGAGGTQPARGEMINRSWNRLRKMAEVKGKPIEDALRWLSNEVRMDIKTKADLAARSDQDLMSIWDAIAKVYEPIRNREAA